MWNHPRLTEEEKKSLFLQARRVIEFERSLDPSAYPDLEPLPRTKESVELFRVEDAEVEALSESYKTNDIQMVEAESLPESTQPDSHS